MKKVVIYTTDYCPFCTKAKRLLDMKGAKYEEIDVTHDAALREEMTKKAEGRRTVPQIFIDDVPVGGCDDLYALDEQGRLETLLS
ncbi:MAG: glutaredoxin 3 [Holosporaceae bacterium]|nr:MAG: glutaredoxin 3 [Holosporaceae bacterium]